MGQSMFHNEEDVKIKYVIEYLEMLGFDRSELSFEKSFFLKMGTFSYKIETEQQVESAQARLDILVSRGGKNLCVIEVKSADVNINSTNIDQAVSYARLVHPIAPVCLITNGKEWKIIDSITKVDISKEKVIAAAEYTPSLPDEAYYEAIQHFLGYSRENLLQFCQQQVPEAMDDLKGSKDDRTKKYIEELYEPRMHLSETFTNFVQSNASCFAVVGDSGSGKSCWACDTALRYLQSHYMVLFYRGVDIEKGIFQAICKDLNWSFSPHYDEVQGVKRLLEIFRQDCILVFIDGIDEIPIESARRAVDDFLKRIDSKCMRLVATCKTTTWEDFLEYDGSPTRLSRNVFKVEELKGYITRYFDEQEFSRMLGKYRAFYQYFVPFDPQVYEDCRQTPFLLRIMFEVASEQKLPYIDYTAIDFYREYFARLCSRFDSPQRDMIRDVLTEIAKCLYIHNIDEVDLTVLKATLDLPVTSTLPHRLFELNILERHDRDDMTYISFYFKKLRDYLIAFRALKWQSLSPQTFKSEIEKEEISGVRLEVLNLYYSITLSEEHKRLLDGPLSYANASAFVSLYEKILDTDFFAFKQAFPPNTSGEIGFVGYVDFSRSTISMHGFRPLKANDTKILLLPTTVGVEGIGRQENQGQLLFNMYSTGCFCFHSMGASRNFQNINIVDEIFSNNISPSLKKILEQGKLDESQNKELLIERVFAVCITYCEDFFEKYRQNKSFSYLPLRLQELKEYILYKIAHNVLTLQNIDRRIASGQFQEQWNDNGRSVLVAHEPNEQAEIEKQAWMLAKQGKNIASERKQLRIDPVLLSLLKDIDDLEKAGIVEISSTPLTAWYDKHRTGVFLLRGQELLAEINYFLESLYLSFLNEYQILVARNFPTLCHKFEYYSYLPAKFHVALNTTNYDPDSQINPLAVLSVLVQKDREYIGERNAVVLSTPEEIYEESNRRVVDPTFSGLLDYNFGLDIYHGYTAFKVKKHLCVLRNMVYSQIEKELKNSLYAIMTKYRS